MSESKKRKVSPNSKKPSLKAWREALFIHKANLSKVADAFQVHRGTVNDWRKADEEFNEAFLDARKRTLDQLIDVGVVVSNGILGKDESGNTYWVERPDSGMLRYMIGILGRDEGWGDERKTEVTVKGSGGISVADWVKLQMSESKKEESETEEE